MKGTFPICTQEVMRREISIKSNRKKSKLKVKKNN